MVRRAEQAVGQARGRLASVHQDNVFAPQESTEFQQTDVCAKEVFFRRIPVGGSLAVAERELTNEGLARSKER